MAGLGAMYGRNPHRQNAAAALAVMPQAGYAAPALAFAAGQEMGQAGQLDEAQAADERQMRILSAAISISRDDPEAANAIIRANAAGLGPMGELQFRGKTKDNTIRWSNAKTGEDGIFNLGGFGEEMGAAKANGDVTPEMAQQIMNRHRTVLVPGQQPKRQAPKSRTVPRGTQSITEEWDEPTGSWREVGRAPVFKPDRAEYKSTSDQRHLAQINAEMGAAGKPKQSLQEYLAWKAELSDPTGMKAILRDRGVVGAGGSSAGRDLTPAIKYLSMPLDRDAAVAAGDALRKAGWTNAEIEEAYKASRAGGK